MRKLYAGLDVSLEMTSICAVDEGGATVLETKVASEPEAIRETLVGMEGAFERVGLEAGPLSPWLASGLKAAGLLAICIEARHAKAAMVAMTRNKNDRNDARSLAHLIRSGWFKAVHVKSVESQELRTLLVAREFFVNKLRDHENEIRGLLRPFGLKVGRVAARDFEARIREMTAGVLRLSFQGEQTNPKSGAFAGAGSRAAAAEGLFDFSHAAAVSRSVLPGVPWTGSGPLSRGGRAQSPDAPSPGP